MSNQRETEAIRMGKLIARAIGGTITTDEQTELDLWLMDDKNRALYEEIRNGAPIEDQTNSFNDYNEQRGYKRLLRDIEKQDGRKGMWRRVIVAATILAFVSLIIGIYISRDTGTSEISSIAETDNDILPGTNRATLTLDDGRIVSLSEDQEGIITGDALTYSDGSALGENDLDHVAYATLTTPMGGQYQITLPDGSKVWLNAGSSLRYPTYFTGNDRKVVLTGEGYFEVKRDSEKPFTVESNGQIVQVLGTSFNINAYDNEPYTATTLVQGSVRVKQASTGDTKILEPHQQAIVSGTTLSVRKVDAGHFTGWKNGFIILDQSEASSIFRQVERWYDVQFDFKDPAPTNVTLGGTLMRNARLSGVLNALEISTGMKFTLDKEERRVMVQN